MLTTKEFHEKIAGGLRFLDGATGSNLRLAGMPKGCSTEEWVLAHPEVIIELQRGYEKAGSQLVYAPTFQAQPIALDAINLGRQTEAINAQLVALSRAAAPGCLVAGDITTLAAFCESWDPDNFDLLVENYRRQIRGLLDGGVDVLVAETLLYRQEGEAVLTAAQQENAGALLFSFTMQPDGTLFSGEDSMEVLKEMEEAGAAAVGFNCITGDMMTPYLVAKMRRSIRCPIICKPNAGIPTIDENGIAQYSMSPEAFAEIMTQCAHNGATLLGGCCGTTPRHMEALVQALAD